MRGLPITPIKNPEGHELHAWGVQTYKADWLYHVCFDDLSWVGGFLHCYRMPLAKRLVQERWLKGEPLVFGSTEHNPGPNTGAGYRITPEELEARSFVLSHDGGSRGALSQRGVRVVKFMLNEWGNRWREATIEEQKSGIDLVCLDKPDHRFLASLRGGIEVKTRGERKGFPQLFVQTHEVNPGRRHV